MYTRIGTATVLTLALVGAALAATAPTAMANHHKCPPDASDAQSDIELGPAAVSCAVAYSAEYYGCDGPVETYVALEPFTVGTLTPVETNADSVPVTSSQAKYYICASTDAGETGLWMESNIADGLQTENFGSYQADTKCGASTVAACSASQAAMP
jgi:hypothetical protein